jgi:hypothetical protein
MIAPMRAERFVTRTGATLVGDRWPADEVAEESGDLATLNKLEIRLWLDGPSSPEGRVGGAGRELALAMNAIALAGDLLEGGRRERR